MKPRRGATRPIAGTVLAALLAACGPRVDVRSPTDWDDDLDGDRGGDGDDDDTTDDATGDAAADRSDARGVTASATTPALGRRTGTIRRADLDTVLAAGPPMFLRGLEVTRHLGARGEFAGWKIVQFLPADRFAGVDLRPGDVIGEVNGRMLSRPDHFQHVWDELPRAAELVIQVSRDGAAFKLRYAISSP